MADTMSVASGQNLKRGSLLDASGTLCTSSKGEEGTVLSEVYAVLAEDCDATSGAKEAAVYLTGEFNEKALIVDTGSGEPASSYKASARKVSIFIKSCM